MGLNECRRCSLYIVIMSLAFMLLGFGGVAAASQGELIVNTEVLNVRPTPGTDYDRIGRIYKEDRFPIIEQQGEWYKIKLPSGKDGWVIGEHCQIIKSVESITGSKEVKVIVDGRPVEFDIKPYINSEKRTMVPIRFVSQELGSEVVWVAAEQKVIIKKQSEEILLWVGKNEALVNNDLIAMDTQAELLNGRTMVPLRFIGESFGSDVLWDSSNYTATISKPIVIEDGKPDADKAIVKKLLVIGSTVNIRSGPSTDFVVVDKVRQGDSLTVIGAESDNWFNVQSRSGFDGWISGDYVLAVDDSYNNKTGHEQLASRGTGRIVTFNGNVTNPDYPALISLEYEELDGAFFLTVTGNEGLWYSTTYLDNPYRLVIDIKGVKVDLPLEKVGNIEINHHIVSKMRVSQFTLDTGRVVLELAESIGYQAMNRPGDKELTFLLKKNSLAGRLIVIDPGHGNITSGGWDDPGATGPTGLKEKDVVMDIANMTATILKAEGAEVILTRNGSTNLTLEGRAELANSVNADLFISIHANASANRSTMGTSTYFYAPSSDPILGAQRAQRIRLAQLVQQATVAHGGRPDLGINGNQPFKVLIGPNMPSVLVETAFLSNLTEELLLRDPSFRGKLATGIAEGIINYFK